MHQKFPKIHRLGKSEVDGILNGLVYVQEKIDGANASLWRDDEGNLHCGSRNNDVTHSSFNGLPEWMHSNKEMLHKAFDELDPHTYLYGEWLVKHTLEYPETAYKKFYLFDIIKFEEQETEDRNYEYLAPDLVVAFGKKHGFLMPEIFLIANNPTKEEVLAFAGKSSIGLVGEGVVIKNMNYINKWGNKLRAKVVTQQFSEENRKIWGNNSKFDEYYWEQYVAAKYVTLGRVEKAINKLQNKEDRRTSIKDTPRIAGMVYNDILTEEIWSIQKKAPILRFKNLKTIITKKAIKIFHDWLNSSLSVAYTNEFK